MITPTTTALLKTMTLEEKAGQLFLTAFSGTDVAVARPMIEDLHIGGVYLSGQNLVDPRQAVELTTALQGMALNKPPQVPLLISADHEGTWAVLTAHSCPGPGNLGLGATGSVQDVYDMYRVMALELAAVGINTNLVPVADVNSNPTNPIIGARAFGEDPELVARLSAAAVRGTQEQGIVACAKHFPGHGDTALDSHRGLARVDRPRPELERIDLRPFQAAIAASADMIMSAHVIHAALDSKPATLSFKVLHDLLRRQLGFAGVILSDSFNMGAIVKHYQPEEAVVQAIISGVDLVLVAEERYLPGTNDTTGYLHWQRALVGAVQEAVRRGEISKQRLDEAVGRVLELKARRRLAEHRPDPARALAVVGSAPHRATELRVARDAVTVVQNRGILPLRLNQDQMLLVVSATDPKSQQLLYEGRGIGPNPAVLPFDLVLEQIRRCHPKTTGLKLDPSKPLAPQLKVLEGASAVVIVTEKYPLAGYDFSDASQHAALSALLEQAKVPVIVLAMRDPYELAKFPSVPAYIVTYGCRPCNAQAGVEVLFGEQPPKGRLPVAVPGLYPVGHTGGFDTPTAKARGILGSLPLAHAV